MCDTLSCGPRWVVVVSESHAWLGVNLLIEMVAHDLQGGGLHPGNEARDRNRLRMPFELTH
jgi:hypothetical protein